MAPDLLPSPRAHLLHARPESKDVNSDDELYELLTSLPQPSVRLLTHQEYTSDTCGPVAARVAPCPLTPTVWATMAVRVPPALARGARAQGHFLAAARRQRVTTVCCAAEPSGVPAGGTRRRRARATPAAVSPPPEAVPPVAHPAGEAPAPKPRRNGRALEELRRCAVTCA
jgi:hypothetical protein